MSTKQGLKRNKLAECLRCILDAFCDTNYIAGGPTLTTHSQYTLGKTTVLEPAGASYNATVILLHGVGDQGNSIAGLAAAWAPHFPHIKFVLPTAPAIPVTMANEQVMTAW